MKRFLFFLMFSAAAFAQQPTYMQVTAANISGSGGLLTAGTLIWQPVDSNGNPIAYQLGNGGQQITSPTNCSVVNGAITGLCQIANTAITAPVNVCFSVIVKNANNQIVLGGQNSGYQCAQPAPNNLNPAWCGATSCNFDQFVPNLPAAVIAKLPTPTLLTLGGVYMNTCPSGQVANSILNTGYLGCVAGGGGGGGGLADPGSNGIVFRSSLNTTRIATSSDIAGVIGYTPANDGLVVHLAGTETVTGAKTFSSTISGNITGNSATSTIATQLAGTPTLCATGQAPLGILANGNATGCFALTAGLGDPGANGIVFRSSFNTTRVATSSDISAVLGYTPANDSLVVHLAGTETITGTKTFSALIAGSVSGNAGTATALAAAPTLCTSGQAPRGVLASGNATGCTNLGLADPGSSGIVTRTSFDVTGIAAASDIDNALGYTAANDSLVVHLAGGETVTGVKTFTAKPVLIGMTNDTGNYLPISPASNASPSGYLVVDAPSGYLQLQADSGSGANQGGTLNLQATTGPSAAASAALSLGSSSLAITSAGATLASASGLKTVITGPGSIQIGSTGVLTGTVSYVGTTSGSQTAGCGNSTCSSFLISNLTLGVPLVPGSGGLGTSTAPVSGQLAIGTAGNIYAPQTIGGDATLSASGALTVTKTNGNSFGPLAIAVDPFTINGTNNSTQSSINFVTSTVNSVGLTATPSNPSGANTKFEITGSSYTGNAATATLAASATALAATPSQCTSGQFSTGIAASGNANCGTPPGGLTGTGLANTQVVVATAASTLTSYSTFTSDSSGDVVLGGSLTAGSTSVPTQVSGILWAGTSVTVPAGYNYSFGVGSDNAFHCQLSSGSACGTLQVNGVEIGFPNFNGTTPSAGAGYTNGIFQVSGSNVSVEVPSIPAEVNNAVILGVSGAWTAGAVPTANDGHTALTYNSGAFGTLTHIDVGEPVDTSMITGTSYTLATSDVQKVKNINGSSACAVSLPQPTLGNFYAGFKVSFVNTGTQTATFTASSSTLYGPASLPGNASIDLRTDGVNWFSLPGVSTSSGGAVSSVSNSDGTLTISPTTGAVIASIALGHANAWTGNQTYNGHLITGEATETSSYTGNSTADSGNIIVMNCSSACTYTFNGSGSAGYTGGIVSVGSTVATVSLNGKQFDGATSVPVLVSDQPIYFTADGSGNFWGNAPLVAGSNVTFTPASNGLTIAASGGGGGGVNTGTTPELAYYSSTSAVSSAANTSIGNGTSAPVLSLTGTSLTDESLFVNCTTPTNNCATIQIGGNSVFFIDNGGNTNIGNTSNLLFSSNSRISSKSNAGNLTYAGGSDSNSAQSGLTIFRGGDATGTNSSSAGSAQFQGGDLTNTGNSTGTAGLNTVRGGNCAGTGACTAGSLIIQPGALTNASPNASATLATVVYDSAAELKGTTVTTGNAECYSGSYKLADCGTAALNVQMVGVASGTNGGAAYLQTAGEQTLNLDATYTYTYGDVICTSATLAAEFTMNGKNPCPVGEVYAGYARTSGTSQTTVPALISIGENNRSGITVVKTSQAAAISTSTAVTTGTNNAMWVLGASIACDSSSAAATVTLTVSWTDVSNTVQTLTPSAATCTTLGSASFVDVDGKRIQVKAGTNITYSTAIANTPTYDLRIDLTQVTAN